MRGGEIGRDGGWRQTSISCFVSLFSSTANTILSVLKLWTTGEGRHLGLKVVTSRIRSELIVETAFAVGEFTLGDTSQWVSVSC